MTESDPADNIGALLGTLKRCWNSVSASRWRWGNLQDG